MPPITPPTIAPVTDFLLPLDVFAPILPEDVPLLLALLLAVLLKFSIAKTLFKAALLKVGCRGLESELGYTSGSLV